MRLQVSPLLVLSCLFLRINLTLATSLLGVRSPQLQNLQVRHGDDHMSVSEEGPLKHINETEILQYHDPDPVAYYQYDYENATPDLSPEELEGFDIENRHGGLMLFHAFTMIVSYLFILPIMIVFANTGHRLLRLVQTSFWALNLLGYSAATAYKRNTPNMYNGSTHGSSGNVLLFLAALTTFFELSPAIFGRLSAVGKTSLNNVHASPKWTSKLPLPRIQLSRLSLPLFRRFPSQEYGPITTVPLMTSPSDEEEPKTAVDPESEHLEDLGRLRGRDGRNGRNGRSMAEALDYMDEINMLESDMNVASSSYASRSRPIETEPQLVKRHSTGSDHSTLHEEQRHHSHQLLDHHFNSPHNHGVIDSEKPKAGSRWNRIGRYFKASYKTLECALVVYGWGQILSGIIIYLGFGRSQWINGTLAHWIKGSIFFWYGILTFARYLGAWRRWEWAWNEAPSENKDTFYSAAFVESFIIFLYGVTQQFMERFGANPGDPYTSKQIEHISIAVMFWGGGLVSMAVESPNVWKWMLEADVDEAAPVSAVSQMVSPHLEPSSSTKRARVGSVASQQTAYLPSPSLDPAPMSAFIFPSVTKRASNPLPALVIGVTGLAMSAHHQTYLFQVQIHALWGYLLLGFAICRCLTCFFEWARPLPLPQVVPSFQAIQRAHVNHYSHPHHRTYSSDEKSARDYHREGIGVMGRANLTNPLPTAATLPGRPPSELVGSVFLGAGGITLICSSEQVGFWVMRTRRDDVMTFLNLAIAFTCVAYVWTTVVLLVNAKARRAAKMRL